MNNIRSTMISALLIALTAMPTWAAGGAESTHAGKIKDQVLKRHPQATELQISQEKHFGNALLKVTFKDQDETNMELFRTDGALYSNVLPVDDPTPLPSPLLKTLKAEFSGYQFKKAELVVNPNGVGEEYGVYLAVNNVNWLVWINERGQILSKSNF